MLLSHGPRSDAYKRGLLTALLCLLTFSFGTFVGKAFTETQTKIAAMASCANRESAFAATQPNINLDEKQMQRVRDATTSAEDSVTSAYYDDPVVQKQGGIKTAAAAEAAKAAALAAQAQTAAQAAQTAQAQAQAQAAPVPQAQKPPVQVQAEAAAPAPVAVPEKIAAAPTRIHSKRAPASVKKPAPEKKAVRKIEPSASAAFPSVPLNATEKPESLLGKYTIQIASVVDEAEATERVNEFRQRGLQAFYVANEVPGMGKRYRVSLGVFSDYSSARDYRHHLDDEKALPSDVIIKKVTLPSTESH